MENKKSVFQSQRLEYKPIEDILKEMSDSSCLIVDDSPKELYSLQKRMLELVYSSYGSNASLVIDRSNYDTSSTDGFSFEGYYLKLPDRVLYLNVIYSNTGSVHCSVVLNLPFNH